MLEEKVEDCEGGRRRLETARKIVEIMKIVKIVEGWCRSAPPKPLSHLPSPSPLSDFLLYQKFFLLSNPHG